MGGGSVLGGSGETVILTIHLLLAPEAGLYHSNSEDEEAAVKCTEDR